MEEKRASFTATLMAYYRAYHAMHETPKIFDDFLACHLFTEDERLFFENACSQTPRLHDPERAASLPDRAAAIAWTLQTITPGPSMTLSRSRYSEDSLENAVGQGVKQYVILGAGFDTFALRRPEMLEKLQVFEVDHPLTQAFKRQRIAKAGWKPPAQLHFVPVDFEQESLAEALTRSSYDPQVPSFFSWLGVTYYLTREAIFATLRSIAKIAPSGSTVIFDYLDTDAFVPEKAANRVKITIRDARQNAGEPMITGFDPSTLAADLASLGFYLQENLSPTDIEERYFKGRTDNYHACEHLHFARAVVE
ncbi:MAG: class I SAM-dependent methyltransferase [Heliobacteriaceae bacterium]|nr:class I SAM-dependent methyltransferase [Heliobacteriaceae bacterium]